MTEIRYATNLTCFFLKTSTLLIVNVQCLLVDAKPSQWPLLLLWLLRNRTLSRVSELRCALLYILLSLPSCHLHLCKTAHRDCG